MFKEAEFYRGVAERELLRWGIESTEANLLTEIENILNRLDTAFGNTDERFGLV